MEKRITYDDFLIMLRDVKAGNYCEQMREVAAFIAEAQSPELICLALEVAHSNGVRHATVIMDAKAQEIRLASRDLDSLWLKAAKELDQ